MMSARSVFHSKVWHINFSGNRTAVLPSLAILPLTDGHPQASRDWTAFAIFAMFFHQYPVIHVINRRIYVNFQEAKISKICSDFLVILICYISMLCIQVYLHHFKSSSIFDTHCWLFICRYICITWCQNQCSIFLEYIH